MTPSPLDITPPVVEARRITGPNLYSNRTGAVIEVQPEPDRAERDARSWQQLVRAMFEAIGWPEPELHVRARRAGVSLYMSAPLDALMTATEVAEIAWTLVSNARPTSETRSTVVDDEVIAGLRALASDERRRHSNLVDAHAAAVAHDLSATFDDETFSIGSGAGARSWPLESIPTAHDVPWHELSDARIALVTGSNGKTTTTRLVSAMWRDAGGRAGWCCSDGVWIDGTQVEAGDYSGPVGARRVLRDQTIDAAVIECARGGMLRRGLAVSRADAAIITNIAADHFGEYGVDDLDDLTDAKRIVARVLSSDSWLVLNADDLHLARVAATSVARIALFTAAEKNAVVDEHIARGGTAAVVRDGRIVLHHEQAAHDLGAVDEMPLTMHGAAPHNVQNILGAALLATVIGTSVAAVRSTLATFGASNRDNPGRLQRYEFGELKVLVDYAHNPDGLAALCETARSVPASRRLLLLGQAGNRDDDEIRELVRVALRAVPFDYVIIKEELKLLRGRSEGDVPRILRDELERLGYPAANVETTRDELTAMRHAFAWARAGDLLVCPIHVEKADVLAWLGRLAAAAWVPGRAMPE